MVKKVNKAQEKRDKELYNSISHLVKCHLKEFQDFYLKDYADFQNNQLEKSLKFAENLLDPDNLAAHNDMLVKRYERRGVRRLLDLNGVVRMLKDCKGRLALPTVRLLRYLTEGKENYDRKVESLIGKLFKYQFNPRFLRIERINDAGNAFSFLIKNDDMEVHARVIYAHGAVNAPHYRFIVTKRNNK